MPPWCQRQAQPRLERGSSSVESELLAAVKKALVQSLERTHRHGNKLTNGALSLSSSRAYELLWACSLELGSVSLQQKENQVCVILTWHIATCYCDKELSASGSAITNEHYEVATRLSKYCAYLVAFAPKLLPGHHSDTWLAFTEVAEEALRDAGDEETIYRKGLRLGEQLKNMQADHCWEVLAGFWAEMLLYLAPSDNVKEHVECLAKGGEFITHLWALLTHAGILDRGQSDVADIENNGGNQPASRPTFVQRNEDTQNVEGQQPHQEQPQGLQPDQPRIEDTQNPVNHHEIEEEEEEEADRGAHVHGNGGFSSLPAQGNYDSNASSSANNQPPVESV